MQTSLENRSTWFDRPLSSLITLNWEVALFVILLGIGVFTRFYDLGTRVMSHDETSHVYFSWLLSEGRGYLHDPVTHGPLQFHLMALSYFLFGDTDFTARIPGALFSIATIAFTWVFRRYLGRAGGLVAVGLMTISPYMLYYGRYARNEIYVAFFGLLMLWSILRYIESGSPRFLYLLTASVILHYVAKETAYIYAAQALLFVGFYLVYRITMYEWPQPRLRQAFLTSLLAAVLLLTVAAAVETLTGVPEQDGGTPTESAPAAGEQPAPKTPPSPVVLVTGALAAAALFAALYFAVKGYSLTRMREERAFDLLILLGTLVLPLLAAFPLNLIGWSVPTSAAGINNLDFSGMARMGIVVLATIALAVGVGLWWNPRLWLYNAALFWGIFVVFYTTLFTNGAGFFTGLLGGLGYWLAQQAVERGSQPWYFYALIQVPVYEYLPLIGSMLAGALAFAGRRPAVQPAEAEETRQPAAPGERFGWEYPPVLPLLGFWVITSFVAYTVAGEKMPWLTVHITWPMILLAGWSFGYLIETTDWRFFRVPRGYLVVGLLFVFLLAFSQAAGAVLGTTPPFQGKTLEQLQDTSTFLLAALSAIASAAGLAYLIRDWPWGQVTRVFSLASLSLLAGLTARTAFTASYINYDLANELLVYAHAGPGAKDAMSQIEEISRRTTNGLDLAIAYDNGAQYPFWWYLRNYPNTRFFADEITRDLRDHPVILVGHLHYADIEKVVRDDYYSFEYIRMWWPNQDYFYLTWERIQDAVTRPEMRAALFKIWLDRDYSSYGKLVGKERETTLATWDPAQTFRLYIRKDVASMLWNYGASASAQEIETDPYEGKQVELAADRIFGSPGTGPGQFSNPRGIAVAPDGSIYVADTSNHRIQHFSGEGDVLQVWGQYASSEAGPAPAGSFNEPWGVAVGPDGTVFVADTWNHRIQKFSPDGQFLTSWGASGQGDSPFAFWGPRAVAVSRDGLVFVSDTGNKRIVVFDSNGNFQTEFGGTGLGEGKFNEPVGVDVDADGRVYIADTWNQLVQVMAPDANGNYQPLASWEIAGWYGQGWDNKPYLSVNTAGRLFITDPEDYRVLEFTTAGEFIRYWGDLGSGASEFGRFINGIAAEPEGGVWVADTANNRVMHFPLQGP